MSSSARKRIGINKVSIFYSSVALIQFARGRLRPAPWPADWHIWPVPGPPSSLGEVGIGDMPVMFCRHQAAVHQPIRNDMIVDHFVEQDWMNAELLYQSPYIEFSPLGRGSIHVAQVDELVAILNEIGHRGIAA